MATISTATWPAPGGTWGSDGFAYLGPSEAVAPDTLDLVSATPDGPTALVLEFNRPPDGGALDLGNYLLEATDGGSEVEAVAVVLGTPEPGQALAKTVRLTLAQEGTDGAAYRVTVDGLTGPAGEALGVSVATWEGLGVGPSVASAFGSFRSCVVTFSEPIEPATLGAPGTWTVEPLGAGALVTVEAVSLSADGLVATLGLLPDLTTVEAYQATAPAGITDPQGNALDVASAAFQVPRTVETESALAWAVTGDGAQVDLGHGLAYELVPASASLQVPALQDLAWACIFTDSRAQDGDALPDLAGDPPYKGGWWADTFAGFSMGSRLWTLRRRVVNDATVAEVQALAAEALAPLVDSGLYARIDATAERLGRQGIGLAVVGLRQDGRKEAVRFADLWAAFDSLTR